MTGAGSCTGNINMFNQKQEKMKTSTMTIANVSCPGLADGNFKSENKKLLEHFKKRRR
jgi:hypothetical protein